MVEVDQFEQVRLVPEVVQETEGIRKQPNVDHWKSAQVDREFVKIKYQLDSSAQFKARAMVWFQWRLLLVHWSQDDDDWTDKNRWLVQRRNFLLSSSAKQVERDRSNGGRAHNRKHKQDESSDRNDADDRVHSVDTRRDMRPSAKYPKARVLEEQVHLV